MKYHSLVHFSGCSSCCSRPADSRTIDDSVLMGFPHIWVNKTDSLSPIHYYSSFLECCTLNLFLPYRPSTSNRGFLALFQKLFAQLVCFLKLHVLTNYHINMEDDIKKQNSTNLFYIFCKWRLFDIRMSTT